MQCDLCGKPFKHGDDVQTIIPQNFVLREGGYKLLQSEESRVEHYECDDNE